MKYDCLVHLYNLYYEKEGKIVKGGLYTNCFIECDLDLDKTGPTDPSENTLKEHNTESEEEKSVESTTNNDTHDYNTICQKAGNYVGDSLQDFIKNPESDPVKFEIEKVAVYDENTSKLMGLALYTDK
jgi:hypothetical protein